MDEQFCVQALPQEVLLHIFSFLDGKDLLKGVVLTCTQWCHLGNEPSLWEHIVRLLIDKTFDPLPPAKTPPQNIPKEKYERKQLKEKNKTMGAAMERYSKPHTRDWKWVFRSKTVAFSEVIPGSAPNGIGYLITETTRYEGEWRNGAFHGVGTLWREGWKYTGEWKDGKESGNGRKRWVGGTIYEGEWSNGYPHGYGVKRWVTGGIYEGLWNQGKENGHGRHTWVDGSYYDGIWLDGEQHGIGIYVWETGNCYEGYWEHSHQKWGIYNWIDGRQYSGHYVESKKHGKGLYLWHDGSCYDGDWSDGLRHGRGIMRWKDGSVFDGIWDNDKRKSEVSSNFPWQTKAMPFDNYFAENMEIWYTKYQVQIQERVRKVKLKIEEIKTRNQIRKLKLSREGSSDFSVEKRPHDNFCGVERHGRSTKKTQKRWKNVKVELAEEEDRFYFCAKHNHYHHCYHLGHKGHNHRWEKELLLDIDQREADSYTSSKGEGQERLTSANSL